MRWPQRGPAQCCRATRDSWTRHPWLASSRVRGREPQLVKKLCVCLGQISGWFLAILKNRQKVCSRNFLIHEYSYEHSKIELIDSNLWSSAPKFIVKMAIFDQNSHFWFSLVICMTRELTSSRTRNSTREKIVCLSRSNFRLIFEPF